MLEYVMLVAGFFLLVKGSEALINGASSLAKRLGVSELMIGLSVMAFGTSLPELLINGFAAIQGNSDISLGNIIGSNIFNILAILGTVAIIGRLWVRESTIWKEIPFALLASLVLAVFLNDVLIDGSSENMLSRTEGLVLLGFFFIFMYYLFEFGKKDRANNKKKENIETYSAEKTAFFLIAGVAGLFIGGRLTVDGAVLVAQNMGISEFLISSTIVAIGTGLPELVASLVAATKKNLDMAVGNVVGSNIFNIFLVLGITSIINPLPFDDFANFDVLYMIATTIVLFAMIFTYNVHRIERNEGIILLLMYGIYIYFIIMRG
jgi:cation:H+ antiporter